ncbi:MAG: polyprenyl synthetase family protein, partial [Pseudomonadota bacterium]
IPKVAGHLMQAGGKRLRPLLTISAADLFGYDGNDHIKLAAAVELIHGATLLHDDVVDESALRRGLSTANLIWGDKESVLVGDFLFSRSFELMVSTGKLSVLDILSRASGVIAEGEVLQLGTQKNIETSFDDYQKVIDAKTAALFAAAAEVGATVAEAGDEACNAMRSFGRHLGLAFQLVDDALDYSGVETSLGKNVGDDFREGKMTAPIVFAISKATPTQKDFWKRTISDGNQRDDDFLQAMSIVLETGAIAETLSTASYHASKALDALKLAPAGKVRDTLEALARVSVHRGQ